MAGFISDTSLYIFSFSAFSSGSGGKLANLTEQRTEVLTFAIIRMVYPRTTKILVDLGLSECQFDHRVTAGTIVIMAKEIFKWYFVTKIVSTYCEKKLF